MEFCDFGTLENLRKMEVLVRLPACFFVFALAHPFLPALMQGGYVTDVRLIRIVIAGVTLGLLYLHSKKMIHRVT